MTTFQKNGQKMKNFTAKKKWSEKKRRKPQKLKWKKGVLFGRTVFLKRSQ